MSDMNYNPGLAAALKWKEDYSDLRLSFDRSDMDARLLAFVRTEMANDAVGADETALYVMLCIAFVKLLQRGAIAPIRPLSSEGERQLTELKASFNVIPGDLRPQEPELSLVEQVAQDFNQHLIPMSEIRRKRKNPEYESAYLEALESGHIV
jgi:hypothetical protein